MIRPTPHYVVKFKHIKVAKKKDAEVNSKPMPEKEKMFVNIVSSDKIKVATSELVFQDGQKGRTWHVPHSLGPVRMEQDKSNSNAATLDCCFHPQTVEMSLKNAAFKDLVVETARESCVRGFSLVKDDVEIDKKYHHLKGVKYKNGDPIVMIIAKDGSATEGGQISREAGLGAAKIEQGKASVANAKKKQPAGSEEPAVKKGFMTAKKTTLKKKKGKGGADDDVAKTGGGGKRGGGKTSDGKEIPFYTISESGGFDLSQNTMADAAATLFSYRPSSIIYRVELPSCAKASQLDLDVSDTKIVLKSLESSASNYELDVALLYPCHGDKGKAKWDKHKKTLAVTLPVKKPTAAELKEIEDKHKFVEEVGETVAAVEALKLDEKKEKMATSTLPIPPVREKKVIKTNTRESFAIDSPIPVNNAAAEQFKKKEDKTSPKGKKGTEKNTPKSVETVKVFGAFTASPKFDGSRRGYVFKKGTEGLGYYADGDELKSDETDEKNKEGDEKVPITLRTNDNYEYRQSHKTVTLLIQVPNIDEDTIEGDFKAKSVGLKFFENGKQHDFFLPLANEIDSEQCSFSVSTKNLIIILGKKEHGLNWKNITPSTRKEKAKLKSKKAEKTKKTPAPAAKAPVRDGDGQQSVVYENFSSASLDVLADLG